ncbi:MAG TPA: PAS-domain containing protein, partial [Rhodocyclaceae bacterium]|nr:PAS-domain containing protein [Rhodocyclaceae bacterium]
MSSNAPVKQTNISDTGTRRELNDAVRLLDVGISIYDDDFRLVFCNPTFRAIFSLPEEQVPLGSPLEPLLRQLAANGAYGDVNPEDFAAQTIRALQNLDSPLVFERTVADGRVFESHSSRLADGGFLTIHTDITHHKQTEARLAEQSAMLRTSIDHMPGAMAVWDRDLRYRLWSKHCEEFFNLPPGTLKVGLHMSEVLRFFAARGDFGPGNIENIVEEQMRPFNQRASVMSVRRMPDGRFIQTHRNPLPDDGYVSVFKDVTAEKQLENELREARDRAEAAAVELQRRQKQIKALLDSSGQGFLSFGPDLMVREEYSQACLTMFGEAPAGRPIQQLLFPDNASAASRLEKRLRACIAPASAAARKRQLSALPNEFKLGQQILDADFRSLEDGDLMLVLTDVTAERSFMELSNTDRLTGLANRRQLDENLEKELERSRRSGMPLTLIIVDIDHFKRINDTHGHLVGDQVLSGIARILDARVRKSDWLGRWGGEEFMVICPNTGGEGAGKLAEKLREAVSKGDFAAAGSLTASFGIAELQAHEPLESLIQR